MIPRSAPKDFSQRGTVQHNSRPARNLLAPNFTLSNEGVAANNSHLKSKWTHMAAKKNRVSRGTTIRSQGEGRACVRNGRQPTIDTFPRRLYRSFLRRILGRAACHANRSSLEYGEPLSMITETRYLEGAMEYDDGPSPPERLAPQTPKALPVSTRA